MQQHEMTERGACAQFNDDLKLRPVKRMDVAVKRELHAEMRALQQQRGEFKRKVYELELKKT
jgi:hypothetical protein